MKSNNYLLGGLGLLALLAVWQAGTVLLAQNMPLANLLAPAPALGNLGVLLSDGQLWPHIWASLQRVFVGLFFALLIGVPVGLRWGCRPKPSRPPAPLSSFCA